MKTHRGTPIHQHQHSSTHLPGQPCVEVNLAPLLRRQGVEQAAEDALQGEPGGMCAGGQVGA